MARKYMRRRRVINSPEISLTPLIDTALTLLIIFMVTTPMLNNSIKVELPKGQAKEDTRAQQELVVHIDRDGKLFFNSVAIADQDALIKKIKAEVGTDTERTIYVKADQGIKYGTVIELVDHIKVVGGVGYVALATQRA